MKLNNNNIQQVKEAKILGTIISYNLLWNKNCENIVKKCNARMQLLRVVASFGTSKEIMNMIYVQIIQVILEGSCQVWDRA